MASQNLQCPSCGAPVRWKGVAPVVECRYCKAHVITGTGEKTEQPAVVRSQVRPRNLAVTWVIIGMVMCTGIVPAVIAAVIGDSGGGGGIKNVPLERITSLSMASSIGQISDVTGVDPWNEDDTNLCVWYRGGTFEYVCFGWDDEHPEHVISFDFHCSEANESAVAIKAWMDHYFGNRLVWGDGYSFYWASSYINSDAELTYIGARVNPDDDEGWEYRLELYWSVILAATLGQDIGVEEATRRQWLGQGYTFASLAKFDPTDDVDEAQRSVPGRFPGAFRERDGAKWTIPIDHPWVVEAELTWDNSKGGKLQRAWMTPTSGQNFTHQKTIRNCISKEFGKSEHHEQDHLAKTYWYSWTPEGMGSIDLHDHGLSVHVTDWHRKTASKSQWKKTMKRLDQCQP